MGLAAVAAALLVAAPAAPARPERPPRTAEALVELLARTSVCRLPPGAATLPASARRGLIEHLRQYPAVALATARQRQNARRILADLRAAAAPWRKPSGARAAGYVLRQARRRRGDTTAHSLPAERRIQVDDGRSLDPRRPEVLIYANAPRRPLVLVGVMFAMPRGKRGPTPAGPIARWHRHRVCVAGTKRGVAPQSDGTCARGARMLMGSEMLHMWLTPDLRSAYAVHAPEPELCHAGLLPRGHCRTSRGFGGM